MWAWEVLRRVVRNTDSVARNTDTVVRNTDGVVRNTDNIVKGIVKGTDCVAQGLTDVLQCLRELAELQKAQLVMVREQSDSLHERSEEHKSELQSLRHL